MSSTRFLNETPLQKIRMRLARHTVCAGRLAARSQARDTDTHDTLQFDKHAQPPSSELVCPATPLKLLIAKAQRRMRTHVEDRS